MPDAEPVRVAFNDVPPATIVKALRGAVRQGGLELSFEVDELPPDVIAAFVDTVDGWLAAGQPVCLTDAPQMLAHTLYKVGRLNRSPLLTVSVRETEPYAG